MLLDPPGFQKLLLQFFTVTHHFNVRDPRIDGHGPSGFTRPHVSAGKSCCLLDGQERPVLSLGIFNHNSDRVQDKDGDGSSHVQYVPKICGDLKAPKIAVSILGCHSGNVSLQRTLKS